MRKTAALFVTTVLVAGLGLAVAAPAGAGTSSGSGKTNKFCKAVKKTDYSEIGNPLSRKNAAKVERQLNRLSRSASGSTKDAIETLADAYSELADGKKARDVFTDGDVISALGTFGVAVGKCALSNLPDITLPDIDLPNVTLPDL
jgi:hypothetical protein